MYKIKQLNQISNVGLDIFTNQYELTDADADAILVRSASMHDYKFNDSLKAIARAGAGVNNIPLQKCSEKGIVVFNTPGANANAVKELVICGLLLSSRKVVEGIEWTKTLAECPDAAEQVEKGKNQFVGPEIAGKKLGVIGLGAIGVNVANAAIKLGMEVYGYDPYMSLTAALGMSRWVNHCANIDTILEECDYISLHAPSTNETKGLINKTTINKMKDEVKILNFARGDLVITDDLLAAIKDGKVAKYVTDFVDKDLINVTNVIAMPHLGASTPESEDNCARMAVKEIMDFLENGNIVNSVNFPTVKEPKTTKYRICIIHHNVPNMLAQFANVLASENINIENMVNKAKDEFAYTIIDTNESVDCNKFTTLDNVINTRIIK